MANFTPSYMHHDTSAGAPAITLFGTGGSSGAGPGAKTVGGTGASGRGVSTVQYGPLDDNAMAVRRALPCSQPDTLLPGEKIFQTCPSVSTSCMFILHLHVARSTPRGPFPTAWADDLASSETKMAETETRVQRETLSALRAMEKDVAKDDWMYQAPRHSLR